MSQAFLKSCLSTALAVTAGDRIVGALRGTRREPLLVGYHRVVDTLASDHPAATPAMTVSLAMLERHLEFLGRRYRFVSLDDVGGWLRAGTWPSGPVAAITFDDGYSDLYHHAFPMLMRKGIPAAAFLVSDTIGTSRLHTHDRLHFLLTRHWSRAKATLEQLGLLRERDAAPRTPFTATRFLLGTCSQHQLAGLLEALEANDGPVGPAPDVLRPLSWDMVATMHKAGIIIGSHTRTHPVLTNEDHAHQVHEIASSREVIEAQLGHPVTHFAYPDGAFDAATVRAVAEAGYHFAYTACRHQDPRHPHLTLARRFLWERSCLDTRGRFSPAVMGCLVNGVYDLATACPQRHGATRSEPQARLVLSGRAAE